MARKRAQKKKAAAAPAKVPTTDPGTSEELDPVDGIEVDIDATDIGARQSERVALNERVEIRGFFGKREDKLRDASLHGVFVETAHLLEVGDPVHLSLPLENGRRLKVSGRVRWVTPFGGLRDARPGMGIELVGMRADTKQQLSALLYRRSR